MILDIHISLNKVDEVSKKKKKENNFLKEDNTQMNDVTWKLLFGAVYGNRNWPKPNTELKLKHWKYG